MKKTLVTLVVMALGLSMTASALPPVTADDCLAGLDMGTQFDILLGALGGEIDNLPTDFEGAGIDTAERAMLLSSAMCADETLADAFAVNKATFMGLVSGLNNLVAYGSGAATAATAADGFLVPFLTNFSAVVQQVLNAAVAAEQIDAQTAAAIMIMLTDETTATALELPYIPGEMPDLIATLTGIGTAAPANPYYAFALVLGGQVPDAFTALLSMSAVEQLNVRTVVNSELLGDAAEYKDLFEQLALIFGQVLATSAQYASQAEAAAAFQAFGASLAQGAGILGTLVLPEVDVLTGIAKAAGEPFSATGDYDQDGVTNLQTYNIVMGNEGTVEDFIAAASGADPFYTGNPLLPAVGIVGLAALISAMTAGGAFVLRKK